MVQDVNYVIENDVTVILYLMKTTSVIFNCTSLHLHTSVRKNLPWRVVTCNLTEASKHLAPSVAKPRGGEEVRVNPAITA